jgi:hypothetical protein
MSQGPRRDPRKYGRSERIAVQVSTQTGGAGGIPDGGSDEHSTQRIGSLQSSGNTQQVPRSRESQRPSHGLSFAQNAPLVAQSAAVSQVRARPVHSRNV